MNGNDMSVPAFRPLLGDIWTAFGLLTRLPLPYPPYDARSARPGAYAAWAYPLVGLVIGAVMAFGGALALGLGLPATAAALLALVSGVLATGALHEDGLADCADGFWGGWTVERRLEIMKDSQIGSYGVIALALGLGLKAVALSGLIAAGVALPALLAAAVGSRAAMVAVMRGLGNARPKGLSHQTGRPPQAAVWMALGIGALAVLWGAGFWALVCAGLAALAVAWVAKGKIGGQTGDVLGATQQVVEIAVLLVCLAAAT